MNALPINEHLKDFYHRYWAEAAIVFASYLITAKIGQYIFFELASSPAIIWLPPAIGLAAVLIYGYPMLIPIALSQFVVTATAPYETLLFAPLITTIAYTGQAYIGARVLQKLEFKANLQRLRDALILLGVACLTTAIGPFIVSTMFFFLEGTSSFFLTWTRLWGGGALAVLTIFPLILMLNNADIRQRMFSHRRQEALFASLAFLFAIYIIFWTSIPEINFFLSIYALLLTLFWIALRLNPDMMILSISSMTVLGMLGIVVNTEEAAAIGDRLFSTELFVLLISPLFLILNSQNSENRTIKQNLSERSREQEKLLAQLEAEDKSKNEFIAILAHELRNPLSSVVSTLEVLKQDTPDTRLIEQAQYQSRHMKKLLDDLLDVTRISQNSFALEKELITLNHVIGQAVLSIQQIIKKDSHTLKVSMPEEPVSIYADPVRINQIIGNLLHNAVKYTPPGGHISLTCSVTENNLTFTIKDNGIGIPPDKLETIFQPFHQVRNIPRSGSGLGIGLSLTKDLVAMHGGTISAHSDGLGKGSTFIVTFPKTIFASPQPEHQQTLTIRGERDDYHPRYSILIIDDNEVAARGMAHLLSRSGHTVRVAHTGKSGHVLALNVPHDVILLDIGLPDMNGVDLLSTLREDGVTSKVILVSGYGKEQTSLTEKDQFDAYLTKPVGIEEVTQTLRAVCDDNHDNQLNSK